MTSYQRIERLLAGQSPDRLPWLPELNDGFIRRLIDQHGPPPPGLDNQTFVNQLIGADQLARAKSVAARYRQVQVHSDAQTGVTTYCTPAGQLSQRQQHNELAGTNYTVEHLLKGPESFAAYKALLEDIEYLPAYDDAQRVIDQVGQTGLVTIDAPASPLMHLIMWDMGIEPTLTALVDWPHQMAELFELMHERNKQYYRIAAAGPGRIVRPMEDTSSQLTSPDMYARHAVPCLIDYANICHAHGKLFIVHMCGHLSAMLDVIAKIPLDGIEAITPPPTGDADLRRMRRRLGDIWLIGGIDPTTYTTLQPQQMRTTVETLLQDMRGDRRFILGHEEIPPTARLENVQIVSDLIRQTSSWFYRNGHGGGPA